MIDPAVAAAAVHAGELDGAIILTISGGSAVFARIFSPFIKTEQGKLIGAIVTSAGVLLIWVYSTGSYSREGLFGLVMGFGSVLSATFGIFTASNMGTLSGAANTLSGGRIGTPKE